MNKLDKIISKIASIDTAKIQVEKWQHGGKKVVFTNGVFDIIHRGHITLLAQAAAFGDFLIVGLNADASVRTLGKGPDRPINAQSDRAFVLAGLEMVDLVVIFDGPTPYELIKLFEPDTIVKGGDYSVDQTDPSGKDYIVGSDLQRAGGRHTEVISLVEGYSTTATAKKLSHGKD